MASWLLRPRLMHSCLTAVLLTVVGANDSAASGDLFLLQTGAGLLPADKSSHSKKDAHATMSWEKLYSEATAVAAENRKRGLSPPLLMNSEACSGSSVVLETAKDLLEFMGLDVYEARNELFKDDKNPFAGDLGPAAALVEAAKAATKANQTLIFKIKSTWLEAHPPATRALLGLEPRSVTMLRGNSLDQWVCKVRDCFEKKKGYAVTVNGEKSDACFVERRKRGIKTLAYLDPNATLEELIHKYKERLTEPKRMQRLGFSGEQVVSFYEDLMEFEMDKTTLHNSTSHWQEFLGSLGLHFSNASIMQFLGKTAGTYTNPGAHKDVIYNVKEVEEALQSHPRLHSMLRLGSPSASASTQPATAPRAHDRPSPSNAPA